MAQNESDDLYEAAMGLVIGVGGLLGVIIFYAFMSTYPKVVAEYISTLF